MADTRTVELFDEFTELIRSFIVRKGVTRKDYEAIMDYVKKNRANTGANTIKSIAVTINGDDATASITGTNEAVGSGTISLPLKREDGWKVCQIYHR